MTSSFSEAEHPAATELLRGLNADQQAAVTTTEGPVLVVAGPGSGKTRVLTHRIAYLMEVKHVAPDRILAVTFTNKAAREMRDRIGRLLGGRSLSGLEMGTFHSFGARTLRRNPGLVSDRLGILPNFLIYDDSDQIDLAKKAIQAAGLDPKQVAPRRMLSRISYAKSMLLSPSEVTSQAASYDDEIVARVYGEYQRLLRKANAVDFDDLLGLPIQLFDQAPSLLERYQDLFQYILVDEYQDTNRVQYVLVSALAARHRNLFVVGDPDQSIYAWRQADIRNILDFEKEFPDLTEIHLELNYRSTRRIVEIADLVIRENTQRIDRRLRTENDEGPKISLRELSDQNHEARAIVDEIRRLMRTDGIHGDNIAIMYRTTAQSRVLEEAFRTSDIPYRIVGGVRFYDRKEVKDVLAVLRLLHNPADDVSLERLIGNTSLGHGIGPKALDTVRAWATLNGTTVLEAFMAMAPNAAPDPERPAPALSGAGRSSGQKIGTVFSRLRERLSVLPLVELFDFIVDETGYAASFDHDSEEEMQRWTNVLELRTDLEKYDVLAPGDSLPAYLEQVALVSDVDTMEDDGRGRVTMITLHSAKGLEYPVVFIAGVEEGLLPIRRAIDAEFTDPQPLEEERRLFYVGITRAEHQLYLSYTGFRALYGQTQPSTPSRFLANIPENHLDGTWRRSRPRHAAGSTAPRQSLTSQIRGGNVTPLFGRAEPPTPPPPAPKYTAGQRVFHNRFGEGVISEVLERRGDQELAINFAKHGVKRLMGSLAPLDVID